MSKRPVKAARSKEAPLSETIIPKLKDGIAEDCIADIRAMAEADPERFITRNYYRVHGRYAESVWTMHFGTFHEFKRQAAITGSRQVGAMEKAIAKHASVDHYKRMNVERREWGDKYTRDNKARFKTILLCSDLHDIEIDPFFLRVLIDTAKRVQPDVVSFVGDVFDLPEFGKYGVDPREWDVVGRIKFAHTKIFAPIREACPGTQMDLIEGNHEHRLLRHLADATPALRAVLSDLHGMTISKLLGLEEFEMNYVAQADMTAFTKSDTTKEVKNNYRIYWDALLAHHFPHARHMGLPGVNGHHHKHEVWPMFSPIYGAYEWHQLGSGHKRSASYCNGEQWHNGFALAHIDTLTKATVIEYFPITNFAVVGGKYYYRDKSEFAGIPTTLFTTKNH